MISTILAIFLATALGLASAPEERRISPQLWWKSRRSDCHGLCWTNALKCFGDKRTELAVEYKCDDIDTGYAGRTYYAIKRCKAKANRSAAFFCVKKTKACMDDCSHDNTLHGPHRRFGPGFDSSSDDDFSDDDEDDDLDDDDLMDFEGLFDMESFD